MPKKSKSSKRNSRKKKARKSKTKSQVSLNENGTTLTEEEETDALLDGRTYVRRLVNHAESDCLFEIKTELEWESCAENGCDDVTDIEEFEAEFRSQQADEEKKKKNELPKLRVS